MPSSGFTSDEVLDFVFGSGTITGNEVYITSLTENVINNGRIHAIDKVDIVSGRSLINNNSITSENDIDVLLLGSDGELRNDLAVIYAGSDVNFIGSGDFVNTRGSIFAGGSISAFFDGDIENVNNTGPADFFISFRHADILAGDNLTLSAGGSLVNHGGRLAAINNLSAFAEGDISNIARQNYTIINDDYITSGDAGTTCSGGDACGERATDFSASEIVSGDTLLLRSLGGDIINIASYIGGYGDTVLAAEGDIYVESLASIYTETDIKKSSFLGLNKKEIYSESAILREAIIQSGTGDVILSAEGNIELLGAVISSTGLTSLYADNDILLDAVVVEGENYAKRKGFSGLSYSNVRRYYNDFYVIQPEITGYNVSINAGRDVAGAASHIAAYNDLRISAGYDLDGEYRQDGSIEFTNVQNTLYEIERGYSFGLSFPGSDFLDSILTGQNIGETALSYLNQNQFFSSIYTLSESVDVFEAAENLYAVSQQASAFGSRLSADQGNGGNQTFFDGLVNEIESFGRDVNPFQDVVDSINNNNGDIVDGLLSTLSLNVSIWSSSREYTESVLSDLSAGGDIALNATQDIRLLGGTQVTAFENAYLNAGRDIAVQAATEFDNSYHNNIGISISGNPNGFSVGVNGSSSSSESDYFTTASITAGEHLTLNADRDISIVGGIVTARSADIFAENDLVAQSLQNTAHTENNNFGVSIDFCVNPPYVCGASGNASSSQRHREHTDDISGIFTDEFLDITVGNDTKLYGGVLAAGLSADYDIDEAFLPEGWTSSSGSEDFQFFHLESEYQAALDLAEARGADPQHFALEEIEGQTFYEIYPYDYAEYCDPSGGCDPNPPSQGGDDRGDLKLTTNDLETYDIENESSSTSYQVSASISRSPDSTSGQVAGSVSNVRINGETRSTISPGEIIITADISDQQRENLIGNLNRDPASVEVVTSESAFSAGLSIDLGDREDSESSETAPSVDSRVAITSGPTPEPLLPPVIVDNAEALEELRQLDDMIDDMVDAGHAPDPNSYAVPEAPPVEVENELLERLERWVRFGAEAHEFASRHVAGRVPFVGDRLEQFGGIQMGVITGLLKEGEAIIQLGEFVWSALTTREGREQVKALGNQALEIAREIASGDFSAVQDLSLIHI